MSKLNDGQLKKMGLAREHLPRHVAIIMDGNGRWAQGKGYPRAAGHRAGTERLREIIRFSSDVGVEALTLYAFSTENWKRPAEEKSILFGLLLEYFNREIGELHENNVRISIWGEKEPFPENVRRALINAEEKTAANTGLKLNICLNYGSRAEILRAVRLCAAEAVQTGHLPEQADFEKHLYSAGTPEVDLLIRTSGEERLSNYLLYQLAYSELYFTPVLWPDFTREAYIAALQAYAGRGRRFGGL
ncbi:MAG: polyprenyl diphosphate synthase [Eubacteriales bacterium]|nr:polyprenyl diphosphate synthase [Eubacteriales bacterium]